MPARDGFYGGCRYGRLAVPGSKPVCSTHDKTRKWEDVCQAHYDLITSFPEKKQNKPEGRGR